MKGGQERGGGPSLLIMGDALGPISCSVCLDGAVPGRRAKYFVPPEGWV